MSYTKASKSTLLLLNYLVLDVQLIGFGSKFDDDRFDAVRLAANKRYDNDGLDLAPRMREQSTAEIKENFVCESILGDGLVDIHGPNR